jgi:hypothetical protein
MDKSHNSPSPMKSRINRPASTSYKMQDEDYSLGSDDISDEFIEIDCAVIDEMTSDNVCKVCWSNE